MTFHVYSFERGVMDLAHAYYMFDCQTVNKSNQSAVAMAAYRSGDRLYSMRDGQIKNYKERSVEPESFILKPDHAPDWTLEREKLWNEVERFESHHHARIARNVVMSLPHQMSHEQQREAAEEYVRENFTHDGMVADVFIHRDEAHNPHVHMLLTTRSFQANGEWEERKSKRVPKLDEYGNQMYNEKGWKQTKSIKLHDWDSKNKLLEWRANWAEKLNEKSRKYDLELTFSDKSYEEQGIDKTPRHRLTQNEYYLEERQKQEAERDGRTYQPVTHFAQKNQDIARLNEQRKELTGLEHFKQEANYKKQLKDLRQNAHVDDKKVQATKLLTQHKQGYIDYKASRDLYYDLVMKDSWQKNIDRRSMYYDQKIEFFNDLVKEYKNINPENVRQFGFSSDDFREELREAVNHVREQQDALNEEQDKHDELQAAAKIGRDYQRELLDMEFSYMYGNEATEKYSYDEKHFATQLIKDQHIVLPEDEIKHQYREQTSEIDRKNNLSFERDEFPVWEQLKDAQLSLKASQRETDRLEELGKWKESKAERLERMVNMKASSELEVKHAERIEALAPKANEQINQLMESKKVKEASLGLKASLLKAYDLKNRDYQDQQLAEGVKPNDLKNYTIENEEQFVREVGNKHKQEQANRRSLGMTTNEYDPKRETDQDNERSSGKEMNGSNSGGKSTGLAGSFDELLKAMTEEDRQQDSGVSRRNKAKDRSKPHRRKMSDGREM